MTAFPSYSTGTVSIGSGATAVVGTGSSWAGQNAMAGDTLVVDGHQVIVQDVTDTTHLAIDAWPFSAVTSGTTYVLYKTSPLRFAGGQAMADVSALVAALNTDGFYVFVPSTATVPDPSYGNDGQFAFQASTGKLWEKLSGTWTFVGVFKGFGIPAPWSSATAYLPFDVATLSGSSYVCIMANTNQTPPNATYWTVLAAKGDTGAGGGTGATGAGYGGSSTTSLAIATGSKVFTGVATTLAYQVGNYVRASSAANGANFMEGLVTAYSGGSLTINVTKIGGSGTKTDWNFAVAGAPGTGDLLSTNNLSDVASAATARGNLGAGDASGPASATDNALARFDATTGKLIQNSEITLGDADGKLTRTAGISVAGTNTNDNAAAGYVGEVIESSVTGVSITSTTQANVTSISLPAGDWDVWANLGIGATSTSVIRGSIATTSATIGSGPNGGAFILVAGDQAGGFAPVGQRRLSLSITTTVYLVTQCTFTGTGTANGYLGARRRR